MDTDNYDFSFYQLNLFNNMSIDAEAHSLKTKDYAKEFWDLTIT